MWKILASMLLKLLINGNDRCHTNDTLAKLLRMSGTLAYYERNSIFKTKQHTIHDPKGREKIMM